MYIILGILNYVSLLILQLLIFLFLVVTSVILLTPKRNKTENEDLKGFSILLLVFLVLYSILYYTFYRYFT